MKYFVLCDDVGQAIYYDHPSGQMIAPLLATSQEVLKETFQENFRSVSLDKGRIVFEQFGYISLLVYSDAHESEGYLRWQLEVIKDLLVMMFGPTVSTEKRVVNFSRFQRKLQRVFDTLAGLCATQQSFIVNSVERLELSDEIRAIAVNAVKTNLRVQGFPSITQVLLLVGSRVLISYAKNKHPELSPPDIILLTVYARAHFRPRMREIRTDVIPIADYTNHEETTKRLKKGSGDDDIDAKKVGRASLGGSSAGFAMEGEHLDSPVASINSGDDEFHSADEEFWDEQINDDSNVDRTIRRKGRTINLSSLQKFEGGSRRRKVLDTGSSKQLPNPQPDIQVKARSNSDPIMVPPVREQDEILKTSSIGATEIATEAAEETTELKTPPSSLVSPRDSLELKNSAHYDLYKASEEYIKDNEESNIDNGTTNVDVDDSNDNTIKTDNNGNGAENKIPEPLAEVNDIIEIDIDEAVNAMTNNHLDSNTAADFTVEERDSNNHADFRIEERKTDTDNSEIATNQTETEGSEAPAEIRNDIAENPQIVPSEESLLRENAERKVISNTGISGIIVTDSDFDEVIDDAVDEANDIYKTSSNLLLNDRTDSSITMSSSEAGSQMKSTNENERSQVLRSGIMDESNSGDAQTVTVGSNKLPMNEMLYLRLPNLSPSSVHAFQLQDEVTLIVVTKKETTGPSDKEHQQLLKICDGLGRDLASYIPYFITKDRTHLVPNMLSYMHKLPGLVHFVFVDRTSERVLAPGITSLEGREYDGPVAASEHKYNNIQHHVYEMIFRAHEALASGFNFMLTTVGDFQYCYKLWFEDEGVEVPLNFLSLLRGASDAGLPHNNNFYRHLTKRMFPSSHKRLKCFELYTLYLAGISPKTIHAHNRRLVDALLIPR